MSDKKRIYVEILKPMIDTILSISALIVFSPIFIVVYILIKMDSKGPAFFYQERLGKSQKVFKIIKFRTMVQDAEKIGSGIVITGKNDSRITKVGAFLRKTSLDELPQLINVIKGDMAIIGPRPPVTYHPYPRGKYDNVKKHRFDVKPGISGLAQVVIRNNGTWDERIAYDLEYVNKISFKEDLKIILYTVKVVLTSNNVYSSK